MKNNLIKFISILLLPGCASYVSTNCSGGNYAHCDDGSRNQVYRSNEGAKYFIENNILYLEGNGAIPKLPAEKEEVLEFAIQNPDFVVMYDKNSEVTTIHRRVFDYQGNTGEILVGLTLLFVGTATQVAFARSNERCFDKHISRYGNFKKKTNSDIFNSDHKGVGSDKWRHDINVDHQNAMRELSQAYACFQ